MRWELLKGLWINGMIKFGKFTLASGKESPYYIDLRQLPSNPKLFSYAIGEFEELLAPTSTEGLGIASVELAGIPLGAALAFKRSLPFVYVRKERKEHGTGDLVEGTLREGIRFVVIDDVLTTGGSILHAVRALREYDALVDLALVLFDRMQGGREALRKEGVQLMASTTIVEAVNELSSNGLMNKDQVNSVLQYLKSDGASV